MLLPLTEASICEHIRDFVVYEEDGKVLGCAALRIFTPELAEIRSVAVSHDCVGKGIGKNLVEFCLDEAKEMGVKRVFVLTKAISFF